MKFINSKLQTFVLVFIILFSIKHYNSQSIEDLIRPKCTSQSISYSILANLSEYLQYENNTDGRDLYKSIGDLKTKRVGTLKDFYINGTTYTFDSLNRSYDSHASLLADLSNNKLDAIIVDGLTGNNTQMFSNDLSRFAILENHNAAFGVQKGNTTLVNQLNEILSNKTLGDEVKVRWLGINYQTKYIDKNLTGNNGTLTVAVKNTDSNNCYKDENGEFLGAEIDLLYAFARKYGYQLNITEVSTYDEQVNLLKNKTADIAVGNFLIREDKNNDIDFSNRIHRSPSVIVVRYENLPESANWTLPYDSVEDFNGEDLGIISNSSYEDITLDKFPDSTFNYYDNIFSPFEDLLMEDIEGFLIDEPIADYFRLLYPERLDYYNTDYLRNQYAFAFRKDQNGTALLNEFNQFLLNVNLTELYIKWHVANTSSVTIDKNLNTSAPTIDVAFNMDLKPLSFIENNEMKGYEIDLLYRFAKEKNYNINLEKVSINDRINYLQDGKANITGGWFTITDERKQLVNFSNPVYEGKTVFAVRVDSKNDSLTLKILDDNHNIKANNTANIQVRFPNATKTSYCVFPNKYNETILINCTINNLTNIDPYNEGFTFNGTSEKMKILYSSLQLDNFLQANSKISGHNNIITEYNKSSVVCQGSIDTSASTTITTTITTTSYDTSTNYNTSLYKYRKSSGGISTGAIIGIAIPCILLALGGIGAAFACKNSASPAPFYGGQESIQNLQVQYANPNDYYITYNIPNHITTGNNIPNNNVIITGNAPVNNIVIPENNNIVIPNNNNIIIPDNNVNIAN